MKSGVEILWADGVRDQCKVVVGEVPVSKVYADRIVANGHTANAAEAVTLINGLLVEVPPTAKSAPVLPTLPWSLLEGR